MYALVYFPGMYSLGSLVHSNRIIIPPSFAASTASSTADTNSCFASFTTLVAGIK